ncbi:MAG: DNA integrity scanning protein DisA nucleotide-binding domain protein [Candidatus Tectomicrobia bacterium]|nr:DNA integrity scanning protein DisA nucleotide-binding domain protein [Candidatus Tectomicrobia bacterium]
MAVNSNDPIKVYDYHCLLGPKKKELKNRYIDTDVWKRHVESSTRSWGSNIEKNLGGIEIPGLISWGSQSRNVYYQMWFTENHQNLCSEGPTERWLQKAASLRSSDTGNMAALMSGASSGAIEWYGNGAIQFHLQARLQSLLGTDSKLPIEKILNAILAVSITREEGKKVSGNLVFIETKQLETLTFISRFPGGSVPQLERIKHLRKLITSVDRTNAYLCSDGHIVTGIIQNQIPEYAILARYDAGRGELLINDEPVCTFADGRFCGTHLRPDLFALQEALTTLEADHNYQPEFLKRILALVETAWERQHGCTLVLDVGVNSLSLPGQLLDPPLDLSTDENLSLAKSMTMIDGALHIDFRNQIRAFSCLLDGLATPNEDRSRGARYNSALRFSKSHAGTIVVVISEDGPISIFSNGEDLTASPSWPDMERIDIDPPTLFQWLQDDS